MCIENSVVVEELGRPVSMNVSSDTELVINGAMSPQ